MRLTCMNQSIELTEITYNGKRILSPFTAEFSNLILSIPGDIIEFSTMWNYNDMSIYPISGRYFVGLNSNAPICLLSGEDDPNYFARRIRSKIAESAPETEHKVFHIKGAKRGSVEIVPKEIKIQCITDGLRFFPAICTYGNGHTILGLYCFVDLDDLKWTNFKSVLDTFSSCLNLKSNSTSLKQKFSLPDSWKEPYSPLSGDKIEHISVCTNYDRTPSKKIVAETQVKIVQQKAVTESLRTLLKQQHIEAESGIKRVEAINNSEIPRLLISIQNLRAEVATINNDRIPLIRTRSQNTLTKLTEAEDLYNKYVQQTELMGEKFSVRSYDSLPKENAVMKALLHDWNIESYVLCGPDGKEITKLDDSNFATARFQHVILSTNRPTIFKAGKEQYLAGPFRMYVQLDEANGTCNLYLKLKNWNSFYGGDGSSCSYRAFPHMSGSSSINSLLIDINVCIGAAKPAIYKALLNANFIDLCYSLNTLLNEVDTRDHWGQSYASFTPYTEAALADWEIRTGMKPQGDKPLNMSYASTVEAFRVYTQIGNSIYNLRCVDRLGTVSTIIYNGALDGCTSITEADIQEAFFAWCNSLNEPEIAEVDIEDEEEDYEEEAEDEAVDVIETAPARTNEEENRYVPLSSTIQNEERL